MASTESEIERLKRRIKQEQATLRQKEKLHQEKLAKQVGKYVLKTTKVTSLAAFKTDWQLTKTDQVSPVDLNADQVIQTLRQIADHMTDTGRYWKIDNLTEVSAWIAKFRSPEN